MNIFRLTRRLPGRHNGYRSPHATSNTMPLTLLDVPLGCLAKIGTPATNGNLTGADPNSSSQGMAQLQAYGLSPGYWVRVLQRTPVIVLQIDHLELAMEKELASKVQVEEICPSR